MQEKDLKGLFNNVEIAIGITTELRDVLDNIMSHKEAILKLQDEEIISEREVLKTIKELSSNVSNLLKKKMVNPIYEPNLSPSGKLKSKLESDDKNIKIMRSYFNDNTQEPIKRPRITLQDLYPDHKFDLSGKDESKDKYNPLDEPIDEKKYVETKEDDLVSPKKEEVIEKPKKEKPIYVNPVLFSHIGGIGFKWGTLNLLLNSGFTTIGGIMEKSEIELLSIKGLGIVKLQEIKRILRQLGLKLRTI